MQREIVELEVTDVSLVKRPANKRKFLLMKSEEKDMTEKKNENGGEEKMPEDVKVDLLKLIKEQGKDVGIDKIVEALKEAGIELPVEKVEVEKKVDEKKDDINKEELPENVQKFIKKMEDDAAESKAKSETAEKIAKEERGLRVKKETEDLVKSDMGYIPGERNLLVDYLIKNEDEFLKTLLKGINALLKESNLYKEMGRTGSLAGTDAAKKVETMAKELMKSDSSLTKEQAQEKVLESNPEMYNEYLDQKAGDR